MKYDRNQRWEIKQVGFISKEKQIWFGQLCIITEL